MRPTGAPSKWNEPEFVLDPGRRACHTPRTAAGGRSISPAIGSSLLCAIRCQTALSLSAIAPLWDWHEMPAWNDCSAPPSRIGSDSACSLLRSGHPPSAVERILDHRSAGRKPSTCPKTANRGCGRSLPQHCRFSWLPQEQGAEGRDQRGTQDQRSGYPSSGARPEPRSLSALKMTSKETPMSAVIAAQSEAWPSSVNATNTALTASESPTF